MNNSFDENLIDSQFIANRKLDISSSMPEDAIAIRKLDISSSMPEDAIKQKTVQGTLFTSVISILGMFINCLGSMVLLRFLTPAILGAFGIIVFIVQQIPAVLYDLGLPDALVQKKEAPNDKELSTVFLINMITTGLFVLLIYFLAPAFAAYYQIDSFGPWLFRLFSLTLFGFLLESIPSVLLKRKIAFNQIALASFAATVSFNFVAVFLVFLNFGLLSLIIGTLISRAVSLLILYKFQSWRISFKFEKKSLGRLLEFGIPEKGISLVGLFGLAIVPVFVGSIFGLEAVGYFNFSDRIVGLISMVPLILNGILFSTFSRSWNKPELFLKLVEKSTQWISFIIFPLIFLALFLGREIIIYIFTDKWIPGIWVYYLSLLAVGITTIGGVYFQAMLSRGETKLLFKITAVGILLQWIGSVVLTGYFGFNGVALAKLLAAGMTLIPLYHLRRTIKIKILTNCIPYLFGALVSGIITRLIATKIVHDPISLGIVIILGILLYLFVIASYRGKTLWREGKSLFRFVLAR